MGPPSPQIGDGDGDGDPSRGLKFRALRLSGPGSARPLTSEGAGFIEVPGIVSGNRGGSRFPIMDPICQDREAARGRVCTRGAGPGSRNLYRRKLGIARFIGESARGDSEAGPGLHGLRSSCDLRNDVLLTTMMYT